jgi:tRNA-specific adenosine deaminase 3
VGSIFNHSARPNVSFVIDPNSDFISYVSSKQIEVGDELLIYYGNKLWFDSGEEDEG